MADQTTTRLHEVLKTHVIKIKKYRQQGINEETTKLKLINPVLKALGWDTEDISGGNEVTYEFQANTMPGRVDYALTPSGESRPKLFIEAKGLGELGNNQSDDRKCASQVLSYATTAGVTWCILTDGDEWRFYNSTAADADTDEKQFCHVRLSQSTNLIEAAESLALMSRDNWVRNTLEERWTVYFVDRRVKAALLAMLVSGEERLARLIRVKVPELKTKQITESLRRLDVQIGLPPAPPPNGGGGETKEHKSLLDYAAEALAASSEPMTCPQMVAFALAAGWQTTGRTPAATLNSALIREIKVKGADSRFAKVGRGNFKSTTQTIYV